MEPKEFDASNMKDDKPIRLSKSKNDRLRIKDSGEFVIIQVLRLPDGTPKNPFKGDIERDSGPDFQVTTPSLSGDAEEGEYLIVWMAKSRRGGPHIIVEG